MFKALNITGTGPTTGGGDATPPALCSSFYDLFLRLFWRDPRITYYIVTQALHRPKCTHCGRKNGSPTIYTEKGSCPHQGVFLHVPSRRRGNPQWSAKKTKPKKSLTPPIHTNHNRNLEPYDLLYNHDGASLASYLLDEKTDRTPICLLSELCCDTEKVS
eukprot:scaffold631816_cov90-Attheya_sp.AAC.1